MYFLSIYSWEKVKNSCNYFKLQSWTQFPMHRTSNLKPPVIMAAAKNGYFLLSSNINTVVFMRAVDFTKQSNLILILVAHSQLIIRSNRHSFFFRNGLSLPARWKKTFFIEKTGKRMFDWHWMPLFKFVSVISPH